MQLSTTARKTTITEGMKEAINSKLAFLNKFLEENTEVHVTVSIVKEKEKKIEVLFIYDCVALKAETIDSDFYYGLDTIADKIKRQISRHNDIKKSLRNKAFNTLDDIDSNEVEMSKSPIVRRKRFNMKPMGELEAIEQMRLLGHSSFMFINADSDFIMCLMYRRKDGDYGIIEGTFEEDEE